MWSWASGVIVMTYDDVSVGAAVSVDARRVLRRAAGAFAGPKAEVRLIDKASRARRRTMVSQR